MKRLQQIIAIFCLFAAGLILTASICGAGQLTPECIAKASGLADYTVYVVDELELNAGVNRTEKFMVITKGLIKALSNDGLCSVVLHENAHIVLKHNKTTNRIQSYDKEFAADIKAAKDLQELGIDPMIACATMVAVELISGVVNEDSDSHPSTVKRCNNIKENVR